MRWIRLLLTLFVILAVLTGGGKWAWALTAVHQKQYTLPPGSVVREDLAINSGSALIEGTVEGDVYAFTERLEIRGKVIGDVISFARETIVTGTVAGDVRAFSHNVDISGTVDRNVSAFVYHLTVQQPGRVQGSILAAADLVEIRGLTAGEANGHLGELRVSGQLQGGSTLLHADRVTVLPSAVIEGDLTYSAPERAAIAAGARLLGEERFTPVPQQLDWFRYLTRFWKIASLGSTILLWLTIRYWLSPALSAVHRTLDDRQWTHLGKGAVLLIAAWAACVVLLVTVVGIPAAMALGAALLILTYLAKIFVGSWAGTRLAERSGRQIHPLLAEGFGVVLLWALPQTPVVGVLLAWGTSFLFAGAVFAVLRGITWKDV